MLRFHQPDSSILGDSLAKETDHADIDSCQAARLVFGFLWLARPTRADALTARTPIPQDGALQSAITKAENDFHSDLTGARSLGDKAALAQRIFETSEDEQQDKLRRYALLVLARDTAAQSARA